MKKFLKFLLAMTLCVVLSLSVFACKPNDKTPPKEKDVAIVAVDGVNVQNVIEALGPISESEYLTINLEFGMENGEPFVIGGMGDGADSELLALSAEIKIKKTKSGYDFIARIVDLSEDTGVEGGSSIVLYYVGGRFVVAYEMAGQVISAEGEDEKQTFNALINELNKQIASDPEMRKVYEKVLVLSQEVKALLGQGAMASLDKELNYDLAEAANGVIEYLKANSSKTLYEIIVSEMEVTESEEEVEEFIFALVEEFCADNPTIATLIERIVSAINAELEPEEQINIREICDALEAEGLSPIVFCEIVNSLAGLEAIPAPDASLSLYQYLYTLTSTITVDDLAKLALSTVDATFTDLVTQILQVAKQTTLGEVMYGVFELDFETFNYSFEELYVQAELTTDSSSRLTELRAGYYICYCTYDEYEGQTAMFNMAAFAIEISYEKFDTQMAIPQAVLKMLQ